MDKAMIQKVMTLLAKGLTSQEAAAKLGLTRQQVAGVKAHQTRKSYDNDPFKISDSDKTRIISWAKNGLSSSQIRSKIRKYNPQQIAAVMAWVTMGKY